MQVTPYQMCINNVAIHIMNNPPNDVGKPQNPNHVTAFEAASILSIAFCKAKEEIVHDIVNAKVKKWRRNIL